MWRFPYNAEGEGLEVVFAPRDTHWGPGLDASIRESSERTVKSVYFSVHPEFDDYEMHRSKPHEELARIAAGLLNAGVYGPIVESGYPGRLILRINDPKADKPRRILVGTRGNESGV